MIAVIINWLQVYFFKDSHTSNLCLSIFQACHYSCHRGFLMVCSMFISRPRRPFSSWLLLWSASYDLICPQRGPRGPRGNSPWFLLWPMTGPYVCHIWFAIYHQYTPVMLASIYHTYGSVMGDNKMFKHFRMVLGHSSHKVVFQFVNAFTWWTWLLYLLGWWMVVISN